MNRKWKHALQVPSDPEHCPGVSPEVMDKKLPILERQIWGWRTPLGSWEACPEMSSARSPTSEWEPPGPLWPGSSVSPTTGLGSAHPTCGCRLDTSRDSVLG